MASLRSGNEGITRTGYVWASLALLDAQGREREMHEHFDSVLALDEDGRLAALREMIEAEYGLDAERLRAFTASRFRVWLVLARRDPHAVSQIARGYDSVFESLDAARAMRRSQTEQQVLRSEFAHEELQPLARILPAVARALPVAPREPATASPEIRRTPRWKFWVRDSS